MSTSELERKFEILLQEHKKILYKVASSYCRDRDSREDLAQEIVVQLWLSFERFDGRVRFSTWMYRIALNVAISFYRRENMRQRTVVFGDEHLVDRAGESEEPEQLRMLRVFIDALDPLNKALILLYLDDHSYLEIADVLGISETNVATKISRLKARMKKEMTYGTR